MRIYPAGASVEIDIAYFRKCVYKKKNAKLNWLSIR